MPHYIIAYLGGRQPDSPEEGARQMQRWKTWIGDLGDAVINPGTPLGPSTIVGKDGVVTDDGRDKLTGFSVVQADDLGAAIEIAKACPFVEMGNVEVAEMKQM